MARVLGATSRRNPELVRLLTATVASVVVVAAVALAISQVQRGTSVFLAVATVIIALPVATGAKLLADRRLLQPGGRRAEDTAQAEELLRGLPDAWWILRDFCLDGAAVEFLAVGPGGIYALDVYRWLERDTGTGFPERLAEELTGRAGDVARAIGRRVGSRLHVQAVFLVLGDQPVRLGDAVLSDAAADVYRLGGTLLVSGAEMQPVLTAGVRFDGRRMAPLEPAQAERLARRLVEAPGSRGRASSRAVSRLRSRRSS